MSINKVGLLSKQKRDQRVSDREHLSILKRIEWYVCCIWPYYILKIEEFILVQKSIKSELNEEAKNFVNGCMTISPKN